MISSLHFYAFFKFSSMMTYYFLLLIKDLAHQHFHMYILWSKSQVLYNFKCLLTFHVDIGLLQRETPSSIVDGILSFKKTVRCGTWVDLATGRMWLPEQSYKSLSDEPHPPPTCSFFSWWQLPGFWR